MPSPAPSSRSALPLARRPGGRLQVGSSPRSSSVAGPFVEADLTALLAPGHAGPHARRAQRVLDDLVAVGAVPAGRVRSGAEGLAAAPGTAGWGPDAVAWSSYDPHGPVAVRRLAGRRSAVVAVVGCGRTGAGLLSLLAAAGVGGLLAQDPAPVAAGDAGPAGPRPEEVGLPRGPVALRRARRVAGRVHPAVSATGAEPARADLVVLVDHHAADAVAADGLVAEGVPHLSVVLRDTDALVGPLVLPGTTPCLRCLDLHRTDADPGWPGVRDRFVRGSGAAAEETATASALAGLAALQVLAHLDGGRAASTGATLELLLPEGVVQQRPWAPHPQCGCVDLPVAAPPAARPHPGDLSGVRAGG
ncbi:TOMM precursor leader peptide-binding protein [Kineococcus arenarius]|uniref:TOMM precursor leader peptide-binding protein n=1 Tax=Kineococcus sp. SYSU DK007 TaxID=3383128 RepID=UPI003D7C80FB